jgi:hypothetical protein
MNRSLLICLVSTLFLLALGGGSAYAGDEPPSGGAPQGPDLCDALECGQPPPSYVPIGWFDTIDGEGTAHGWTCDANDYGAALQVHFYDGGAFIGAATANSWREQAVADNCGGNPYHGFVFHLPASVRDGRSHVVYAYAINIGPGWVNPNLSGSPRTYTAGPSDPWCLNVSCAYIENGVEDHGGYTYYGGGCRYPVVKKTYKGGTGAVHWIYYQRVRFCWRNGRITSFSRERWTWQSGSFFNGWSFEGHTSTNCWPADCLGRGVGLATTSAWTQGKFKFCSLKIVLCHEVAPLVGIRVYGTGRWVPFYDYPQ